MLTREIERVKKLSPLILLWSRNTANFEYLFTEYDRKELSGTSAGGGLEYKKGRGARRLS